MTWRETLKSQFFIPAVPFVLFFIKTELKKPHHVLSYIVNSLVNKWVGLLLAKLLCE